MALDDVDRGTPGPRRERRSPKRRFRRLYHAATVAQLTELARRLRRDTVEGLAPDEALVEDDAVLVAGVGRDTAAPGTPDRGGPQPARPGGTGNGVHAREDERWAWLLLTTERLRWIVLGDDAVGEVALAGLVLTRWSTHTDVLRWVDADGSPMVMTLSFPVQSRARALLVDLLEAAAAPSSEG